MSGQKTPEAAFASALCENAWPEAHRRALRGPGRYGAGREALGGDFGAGRAGEALCTAPASLLPAAPLLGERAGGEVQAWITSPLRV